MSRWSQDKILCHNSSAVSSHKHYRLLMFYLFLSVLLLLSFDETSYKGMYPVRKFSSFKSGTVEIFTLLQYCIVTRCLMPNSGAHVVSSKRWATNTWRYSAICQTVGLICCLHKTFTYNLKVSHQHVCNWWRMSNSHTKFVHFKLGCIKQHSHIIWKFGTSVNQIYLYYYKHMKM